jgi:prepilin-type N-terminal cleavage/methylation domain-containing protein
MLAWEVVANLLLNVNSARTWGRAWTGRRTFPVAAMTLVEVMIVVAIIGILAAIAYPGFQRVRMNAQNGRYIADLRTAKGAYMQRCIELGNYPPDCTPAIIPVGMADYLGHFPWTSENSLGGLWDWDFKQFGCVAGVSVYQPKVSQAQMLMIDKTIDDGDLSSGAFRQRTAGFISIME